MLRNAEKSYKKLVSVSNKERRDFFSDLVWPDKVSKEQLWMPEHLLTIYGTDYYNQLDHDKKVSLSQYECINLFCLNVYGIKSLISLVSRIIYQFDNEAFNEYLHCFIDEENKHMWYFHKFCNTYAGKVYSAKFDETKLFGENTNPQIRLFLTLTLILAFEMIGDIYNKETLGDDSVNEFVRSINRWHHEEESRHIAFGKISLKELVQEISEDFDKASLVPKIENIINYTNSLFYNPNCFADAQLPDYLDFWLDFSTSERKKDRDNYFLNGIIRFYKDIGFDLFKE